MVVQLLYCTKEIKLMLGNNWYCNQEKRKEISNIQGITIIEPTIVVLHSSMLPISGLTVAINIFSFVHRGVGAS